MRTDYQRYALGAAGLCVGFGLAPSSAAAQECMPSCTMASAGAEPPYAMQRFTIGLPVEVTVVGLTAGIRPEVLYRVGNDGSRHRLRAAVGLLDGPDQFFLPVDVGYRALFNQRGTLNGMVGAGGEWQNRIVSDLATVRQYGLYVEGGIGIKATERLSFDLAAALDVMFFGGPGAGLGMRLGVHYAL